MKILIIGATGTIGKALADKLSAEHQVIRAAYSGGDIQVDLGNPASIREMFATTGPVDAVISTAGLANFAPLTQLQDSDYQLALNNKLMGQINLIRLGSEFINDGGSVTLTSGILAKEPMPGSASIAMANGALQSFVLAAALEETRINLNVVAPAFVKETMEMMGMDSSTGISAADTASGYIAALTGHHGETLDVRDYL
ncbi:short chain dehydrogenase [Aliamphritea spongicola]|uniref:short chain dehydrogenase n=1 Tax=Aliamphritea spongicola TaxID=707589 RepID=UPI00196ABB41|nr:short chain dehydrogenase [Aliamphritea spongicola]MBN3560816.1 short chain dehydrogenase [Aliamphritea spongicola]